MKIKLVDEKNKTHTLPAGFSFWYLFFGPFYALFRKKILYGLLVIIYYIAMIPKSLFEKILESFINDEYAIMILAYPHFKLDIITSIIIVLIPHMIVSIFFDNYLLQKAIEKKHMLPANDIYLEKLISISKKYQNLPIDKNYIENISIINNTKNADKAPFLSKLEEAKQKELDVLYHQYYLGLISEDELINKKNKLFNKKV